VGAVETRPLWAEDLTDLARLFNTGRNTRRCWCMSFCTTRRQFALGWLSGANRRRFEDLAGASSTPMGVLAWQAGEPVGWCACGPRSRYAVSVDGRSSLLRSRLGGDDDEVWLVACLFVSAGHRGRGVTYALVRAAVELARREGALAIEGWPSASAGGRSGDAFVGREKVFDEAGFTSVDRPNADRVIMRLELRDSGTSVYREGVGDPTC
jgi:GNAT superfamily N-acetyltransferase